jgi:hypothetical protein
MDHLNGVEKLNLLQRRRLVIFRRCPRQVAI